MVSNKRITTKVTITKETSISAILEAETKPAPKPDNPPPENPEQGNPTPPNPNPTPQPDPNPNPSNPTPNTKYKVTVTQPANGTIEVVPALPADGMVDKGSELTFTLSANAGYKVKALTIGDATYSDVTDNTITQKVKIEKETAVSAVIEEEATPTPETGIFTDTQGNKVTIEPVKIYGGEIIGYRLTGDIYIEEINSEAFKAKLDTLNGKDLYTDSLNINCFTNQNSTLTAKEITPEVLTGVLTIGKEKKFSAFRLNNKATDNSPIEILFTIKNDDENKHFNISDLAIFSFNEQFKLDNKSNIFLRNEQDARVKDLLKLIENPKLTKAIKVGKLQLRGNVKNLLPYLVKEKNTIEQEYGNITWQGAMDAPCTGDNWVGFNGIVNDNGDINNKGRSILKADELLELKRRSSDKEAYIRNAIIKDLDSTKLPPEKLADIQFKHDILTNVKFENSNLSKIYMEAINASLGKFEFENSTLPQHMTRSTVGELILKDVTFPKEEFEKSYKFEDLPYAIPHQLGILTIYGKIQNSMLENITDEELEKIKKDTMKPTKIPGTYTGTKQIWDKLQFLFIKDKQTELHFINESTTGAIQKPQDTFLALLGNSTVHG